MIVQLEQVIFDHDGKAIIDGVSLRVDRSTPAVEWIHGAPTPSPAAYALVPTTGQALTIQVQFSFPDITGFPGTAVAIRAQTVDPDNAPFGGVTATVVPIPPATANHKTPLLLMPLAQLRLIDHGVGRYPITLRWQFQLQPGGPWLDFDSSDHVIYVTLDLPGDPWTPSTAPADVLRLPWTRVLDWSTAWASGITIEDGHVSAAIARAGKRVEAALYALGQRDNVPLQYLDAGGGGAYAVGFPGLVAFLCTKFLRLLDGDTAPEIETQVDCSDCAAALVTFANVLGCDLSSRQVGVTLPKATFHTNQVVSIGRKTSNPRGYDFSYHEVAGRGLAGAAVGSFRVFDACLMIDRDADPAPTDPDHTFGLARGLSLATQSLPPATFRYVHRLIKESDWPDLNFADVAVRCLDECDGVGSLPDAITDSLHQTYLDQIISVASKARDRRVEIDLAPIRLPGFAPYHRDLKTPRFSALKGLIARAADFYYVAASDGRKKDLDGKVPADERVRLCVGFAKTPPKAQDALAWMLAQSAVRLSLLVDGEKSGLGDAGFEGPRSGAVFFVRGNSVAWLTNIGSQPAPLLSLAAAVDLAFRKSARRRAGSVPARGRGARPERATRSPAR